MPSTHPRPSNRLAATLFLLFLCMTAGFAALNWLHDLSAAPAAEPRALSALGLNRDAPAWTTLLIGCVAPDARPLPFHHFYIDERGEEEFTSAWRGGLPDADHARAIHVLIVRSPRLGGISRRQWETLVARVRTLQARYAIAVRNTSLDTSDRAPDAGQQEDREQLRRMMQLAGLSR